MFHAIRRFVLPAFVASGLVIGTGAAHSHSGTQPLDTAPQAIDVASLAPLSLLDESMVDCSQREELALARAALELDDQEAALIHLRTARRLLVACGGMRDASRAAD